MSESVLLVDDDEDTGDLMCDALRLRGFDVESVNSAACCLSRLEQASFAVVVTDVQMPGMSGLELCSALQVTHPGIRVLVMSGLKSLATVASARARGASSFLAKPVSVAVLADQLRQLLTARSVDAC